MTTNVKEMMASANAAVPKIAPEDARAMISGGNALVTDVRDANEVEASGKIKGAVNIPRGMLDFVPTRQCPLSKSHCPGTGT